MDVTTADLNKIIGSSQDGINYDFDYEATRKKYFTFLNEFCDEIGQYDPWTCETQKNIFNLFTNKAERTIDKKRLQSEYDIALIHDNCTLILANTTIEVLSFEDCFDVFVDAHNMQESRHRNYNQMTTLLEDHYVFHKKCLKYFLISCNVCGPIVTKIYDEENLNKLTKNDRFSAQLDILDLKNIVGDNPYRYLLVYIDNNSDYTILRVLCTLSVPNMGSELMKIFTDFGPPSEIQVIKSMVPSINQALNYVAAVMSIDCQSELKNEPSSKSLRAFVLLKDLIVNQTHVMTNIMTACFFIQKTLNSITEDGASASQKLFGKRVLSDIIEATKVDFLAVNLSEDHTENIEDSELIQTETRPDHSKRCHVCNEVIFNLKNECSICKQAMHLLCGLRLPARQKSECSIQYSELLCIDCHKSKKTGSSKNNGAHK